MKALRGAGQVSLSCLILRAEEKNDAIDPSNRKIGLAEDPEHGHGVVVHLATEAPLDSMDACYRILKKAGRSGGSSKPAAGPCHVVYTLTVTPAKGTAKGRMIFVELADIELPTGLAASGGDRSSTVNHHHGSLDGLDATLRALEERRPSVPYARAKLALLLKSPLQGESPLHLVASLPSSFAGAALNRARSCIGFLQRVKGLIRPPPSRGGSHGTGREGAPLVEPPQQETFPNREAERQEAAGEADLRPGRFRRESGRVRLQVLF